jgi:hypothetical protein
MSNGLAINIMRDRRWMVARADGLAAAAGVIAGDEIVGINGKPRRKCSGRPKVRRGDRITVLRGGKRFIFQLGGDDRSSSSQVKPWLAKIAGASPQQLDQLAKEVWVAHGAAALSDEEAQQCAEALQERRNASRARKSEASELPLTGGSVAQEPAPQPAVNAKPSGWFQRDRERWMLQQGADALLAAFDHRLANLLANKYLYGKFPHPLYLHAFPSLDRLARELKCGKKGLIDSLRRLESRGHIAIIRRRGRGQANAIALRFIEVVPSPGGTTALATPDPTSTDGDAEALIVETVDCAEDIAAEKLDGITAEVIEPPPGAAVEIRPSPIAIANGTRRAPRPSAATKADLAEDEAKRVEAIKRRDEIDWLVANQARTTGHTHSYDSCAWPEIPVRGSCLADPPSEMPTNNRHWYGKK